MVIRASALAIQRTAHRSLCTFNKSTALAVVPRGVVRNDFKTTMLRELVGLPQVRSFPGLTEKIVAMFALDAESLLFDYVAKGKPHVDESGRGIILEVDREFRWKLNGVDGHYYYLCSLDESIDLTANKERRRFVNATREIVHAQTVYLTRMRPEEIAETSEAFRLRLALGTRGAESSAMALKSRPAREPDARVPTPV